MILTQILPGYPAKIVGEYIAPLVEVQLIRPGIRNDYTEIEAEAVRTYARMIRIEGHPPAQALGLTIARFSESIQAMQENQPALPFPAGIAISRLSDVVATTGATPKNVEAIDSTSAQQATTAIAPEEFERLRTEKEAAERREHLIMTEMSQVRARFERFREETATLRRELSKQREEMAAEQKVALESIRDIDEERQNSRFRIARIESALQNAANKRPFWTRLKAALGVLFGNSTSIPLLPESIDRTKTNDFVKAA